MRRPAPVTLVTFGVLALLSWYVIYTRGVVRELRQEASRVGLMYARVYNGLSDPNPDAANAALLDLSRHIRESGVPLVITDAKGRPTAEANLPFTAALDSKQTADYIRALDEENKPIVEPGVGTVHYGNTPLVRGLILIPLLQSVMIALFLLGGAYALRTRGRADREQIWAGMARESAHQLGTPLSSISGWIELLRDADPEPEPEPEQHNAERPNALWRSLALDHMEADLDRLQRVAHRFERIGRPPKQQQVDLGGLVDHVAAYFRARVPTLAQRVTVVSSHEPDLVVEGDPVLLEWAVESVTKNAIDALAGRDGKVEITASSLPEGRVRIRVCDDGPGVPREIRNQIFDPGFSTKEKGWGIGLSLARRIVRDSHAGELLLVPSDKGATFDIVLG